jgi:hypothetical protein
LSRDQQGNFLKPDGSLIEKDSNNKFVIKSNLNQFLFSYIGADKQPLPKNEQGNFVYSDTEAKRLPTDSSGKIFVI